VRWALHDGIVDDDEARRVLRHAAARPRAARAAHRRALRFQGALYDVLAAVAEGHSAAPEALEVVNTEVARATAKTRLVPAERGFRREWLDRHEDLAWILAPVARSAADLLVSEELERLKRCPGSPGKPCGFVFVDETKNRSRRWCSSATCGNRTRLHRHYARLPRERRVE
jgi:predicted RNA-binding Zn ribbon-like protein